MRARMSFAGVAIVTGLCLWIPTATRAAGATPSASTHVPLSVSQCRQDGWQRLTNSQGQPFPNQGQCISYAIHNPASSGSTQAPLNAQQCKHGGWRGLTNAQGQTFRNQGQCVSWTHKQHVGGAAEDHPPASAGASDSSSDATPTSHPNHLPSDQTQGGTGRHTPGGADKDKKDN